MEDPFSVPTPPPLEAQGPADGRPKDVSGRTLGDFQLIRRIGAGGMGQVYLASQLSLKRQVAIKILRADLASNVTALERFKREAEAVARVTHANIVQVYWIGESDGLHYMALEYVEGRNLREYLARKGPPELPVVLSIMRQVAAALQRASELGLVHRDIKPENILLTRKGEVKVADFGLSRCFDDEQAVHLTQTGVTMGTPLYMSPEQVQGRAVDPRSDIYSFGVTSYHMLAGEPPFRGESPFDVAFQHVQDEPRPLLEIRPDVPAELAALVHKMMAKRPEDRYQAAREILRELSAIKERLPGAAEATSLGQSAASLPGPTRQVTAAASNVPAPPSSAGEKGWRPLVQLGLAVIFSAGVGALIHWKRSAAAEQRANASFLGEPVFTDPTDGLEKELTAKLHDANVKSDRDVVNALLELTMLEIRQKRMSEALNRFEVANLRKLPAVIEAAKLYAPKPAASSQQQFYYILSSLGKGIVLAYEDLPAESNKEFLKVLLPQAILPTKKDLVFVQVEPFFWRFDHWKRALADAIDRNGKNLEAGLTDEALKKYRSYAPKVP